MISRWFVRITLSVVALASGVREALPQTAIGSPVQDTRETSSVEVTPFFALGSDFTARVGGALSFPVSPRVRLEAEVGYARAAIDTLSAGANLLHSLSRSRRIDPYLAAGIGLEQYGVGVQVPTLGVITQRKTGLSWNLGGGVKVPITGRWSYRADVRWLNSTSSGLQGWRLFHGATLRTGAR